MSGALFAQMGFEAVVLNRVHYALKDDFKRSQHMEFVWHPSASPVQSRNNSNQNTEIFAHILHTHYSAPEGFDWENGVQQVEGVAEQRATQFMSILNSRAQAYR